MKRLLSLSTWLKEELDRIFKENPDTTFEYLVDRFFDKFVDVPHIGRMPVEAAQRADKYYGDQVDFMMSHEGMTPEEYYVQHYMDESTAKSIVEFYNTQNGIEKSLKDLAYYLYRNNTLHFGNRLEGYHLVPISAKHIDGKTARDYLPVHKLYKPRYFQVVYGSEKIRSSRFGAFAAVIQPDRRKNEYVEAFGPAFFVLNPYTLFRPV
ncbi:MAG: hypothetical protein IKE91_00090 [Clostridia bacterium]|nr:hypothetical protein [Clostridia bacterium]